MEERDLAVETLVAVPDLRRLGGRRDDEVTVRGVWVTMNGGSEVAPVLAARPAAR